MAQAIAAFARQQVVIATQHAKARALRPAFRRLGLAVRTVRVNTDALGTFSGEIERTLPPLECALEKCRLAHRASGEPYCIGSEGSFGPHPHLPFASSHHEILAFTDFERSYSVHEQIITFETNFAAAELKSPDALKKFADAAGFPEHALLLRSHGARNKIAKGIRSWQNLFDTFARFQSDSAFGEVRVETDMRAHMNPTRMRMIALLARKLARRLSVCCNECGAPGYGLVDTESGLPCDWCGQPTRLVLHEIHGCALCGYRSYEPRHDGLKRADPAHCDYCNP